MNLAVRTFYLLCLGAVFSVASSALSSAQSLPAGKGREEFSRMCSGCHNTSTATSQRKTSADWSSTVHDMVTRGAQGSPAEIDSVVAYLSANFGDDKATPANPAVTPQASVEKASGLSASEVARGNELIKANGCLSCHRVGGAGSYVGPDLSDIGSHRTPEQINKSIVSPSKDVLPENRGVRVVTRDGHTVEGKILNQDGLSVQLIDSDGQLRSFQRSQLREFTILDQNSMPSYSGKMSSEDLAALTLFLGSLKEVNLR